MARKALAINSYVLAKKETTNDLDVCPTVGADIVMDVVILLQTSFPF